MSSQGPNSPSTLASDGTGTFAWTNPGNASASDDARASATSPSGPPTGFTTDGLNATGFGFSVPSHATINGVTVEIERRKSNGTETVIDSSVRLIKGGTPTGDNKADGVNDWPTADAYKTYGGSADLWGSTLTPADVNASGFGVSLVAAFDQHDVTAEVDHIRITVHYTTGDAVVSGGAALLMLCEWPEI